ncbi:MAG: hypothetical protein K2O00_08770 [Muribaculaceae bacterium]|nr:hypothetical protein [Muribaculaceae bacterium]
MKLIKNRFIPFGNYSAINLFGVIFVREGIRVTPRLINHESIHTAQMRELLYLPFYFIYILEWIVRLAITMNLHRAYRTISFEREAYDHDAEPDYISCRRHFGQWQLRKSPRDK